MQIISLILSFIFSASLYASESSTIIHYIAERHIHSGEDDYMSYQEAKEVMSKRKLRMTCGSISQFAERYLLENGIPCRFILTLTFEEWNGYNNGHSMIEIFEEGKWQLWDIDQKCYFLWNGEHVDAKTFCEISDRPFEIIQFCDQPVISEEDADSWFGQLISTEEGRRWFYARACQLLMIRKNGIFYFTCNPFQANRIISYPFCGPFVYLSEQEFNKIFIGESRF